MATSFVTMICYDDIYKSFFWHHNFSRGQMNESIFRLAIEQPLGPWFEFPERSRAYCILSICKMRFHQFSLGRKISLRQKQNDYVILSLGHAAVATRVVHFRWQASQWPRMTIWTFSRARLLPPKKGGGSDRLDISLTFVTNILIFRLVACHHYVTLIMHTIFRHIQTGEGQGLVRLIFSTIYYIFI